MKLDQQAIKEFKQIYLEEYGWKISDEQVKKLGNNLIRAVRLVLGPISVDSSVREG